MLWRETPTAFARSSCVHPRSVRSSLTRFEDTWRHVKRTFHSKCIAASCECQVSFPLKQSSVRVDLLWRGRLRPGGNGLKSKLSADRNAVTSKRKIHDDGSDSAVRGIEASPATYSKCMWILRKHSNATGSSQGEPQAGAIFTAFDGALRGKNLLVVRNKMIVQAWRSSALQEDRCGLHSGTDVQQDAVGHPCGSSPRQCA